MRVIINLYYHVLCIFYRHAKRMTVNTDDVKLLVRKCPELVSVIDIRFHVRVMKPLSITYIDDTNQN